MHVDTLHFLASYYNMSIFHYHLPKVTQGRDYMLEINPGFAATNTQFDKLNMIDARWIDTETGLFIDITTIRPNITAREEGIEGALQCKDKHHYLVYICVHKDRWSMGLIRWATGERYLSIKRLDLSRHSC